MHVCMYVCMYVCIFLCMYVCIFRCVYTHMYAWMYVCMYVYVCMHVCMYLPICYIYLCICLSSPPSVCLSVSVDPPSTFYLCFMSALALPEELCPLSEVSSADTGWNLRGIAEQVLVLEDIGLQPICRQKATHDTAQVQLAGAWALGCMTRNVFQRSVQDVQVRFYC